MQLGQYSYLLAGLFGWLLLSYSFFRIKALPLWLRIAAIVALAVAIVVVWWLLRPVDSSALGSTSNPAGLIGSGKPVVLEFYSEY